MHFQNVNKAAFLLIHVLVTLEEKMRRILNDIWISKKIFTMLSIGFVLTILPILVAFSTQNYYDEVFLSFKKWFF